MLATANVAPSLESLEGQEQANTLEFFRVWSEEVLATEGDFLIKLGNAFMTEYMRARLGKLFKLTTSQAEAVIKKVIDSEEGESKGKRSVRGVLKSIEDTANFKFQDPCVPESAAAISAFKRNKESSSADDEKKRKRAPTISEEILDAGEELPDLPTAVFDVLETGNPKVTEILEHECELLTDAVFHEAGRLFGRWNLGVALRRKWANQLHDHCPLLPAYGGKPRKFQKMLEYKQTNRSNVRAIPLLSHSHAMLLFGASPCVMHLMVPVLLVFAETLQMQDRVQGQRAHRRGQEDDGRAPQAWRQKLLRLHHGFGFRRRRRRSARAILRVSVG